MVHVTNSVVTVIILNDEKFPNGYGLGDDATIIELPIRILFDDLKQVEKWLNENIEYWFAYINRHYEMYSGSTKYIGIFKFKRKEDALQFKLTFS